MAAPNMIENLGGGLFSCFDDFGICLYGFCCPICQIGESIQEGGVGDCMSICLCWACVSPIGVAMSAMKTQELNKKLGGTADQLMMFCACFCCCPHCQSCQLARAVKKAKGDGLAQRISRSSRNDPLSSFFF